MNKHRLEQKRIIDAMKAGERLSITIMAGKDEYRLGSHPVSLRNVDALENRGFIHYAPRIDEQPAHVQIYELTGQEDVPCLFSDIAPFIRSAGYAVDIFWGHLEEQIQSWNEIGKLELDPEFQRAHVWNETRQRRFVEFMLRGGDSARNIYFNCSSWMGKFDTPIYLVDGKQRLEAARRFVRDDLTVFGGHYFSDYSDTIPLMCRFRFHVNNLPTYEQMLTWYLEINDGGVVHTEAELDKVRRMVEREKQRSHKTDT